MGFSFFRQKVGAMYNRTFGGTMSSYHPALASKAISQNNSTTSVLANDATFTGSAEICFGYSAVSLLVYADQASASDGVKVQWSTDGTNYDYEDSFSVSAATGASKTFPVRSKWYRVSYTNGGVTQTVFRLQTMLSTERQPTENIEVDLSTDESVDFATSALQTTGNASLTSMDAKLPSIGTQLAAASLSVAQASDETFDVAVSSLPLPSGSATEATLSAVEVHVGAIQTAVENLEGQLPASLGATTGANSLSVVPATDASFTTSSAVVGSHGNAWNAASPLANGTSTSIDCEKQNNITIFGDVSASCQLKAQFSQNDSDWYDSSQSVWPSGAEDFEFSFTCAARYIRLHTDSAITITATIAGK